MPRDKYDKAVDGMSEIYKEVVSFEKHTTMLYKAASELSLRSAILTHWVRDMRELVLEFGYDNDAEAKRKI